MIVEYVSVKTGRVLDTVTVPAGDALPTYATGVARPQVETIMRVTKTRPAAIEALRSWSNGYVLTREKDQ